MREGRLHARRVEARNWLLEAALLAQNGEELSAEDELKQHVELLLVLEGGGESQYEWMLTHCKEVLFVHHVFDLLRGDDLAFAHALERIGPVVVRGVDHKLHASKRAHS